MIVPLLVVGAVLLVVFVRFELGRPDPAVDIRVLRRPEMWPVQATAFLVGISLLGAQGPLATYAGTDRSLGYGLGLDATDRSNVIGVYLVSLIVGAILFAVTSRRASPRVVLIGAAALVGVGYLLLVPLHTELWEVLLCLAIAGLGSGALVAAMPAAGRGRSPARADGRGIALTNTTKTIGGTMSSAVFGGGARGRRGRHRRRDRRPLAGYIHRVGDLCGGRVPGRDPAVLRAEGRLRGCGVGRGRPAGGPLSRSGPDRTVRGNGPRRSSRP